MVSTLEETTALVSDEMAMSVENLECESLEDSCGQEQELDIGIRQTSAQKAKFIVRPVDWHATKLGIKHAFSLTTLVNAN